VVEAPVVAAVPAAALAALQAAVHHPHHPDPGEAMPEAARHLDREHRQRTAEDVIMAVELQFHILPVRALPKVSLL